MNNHTPDFAKLLDEHHHYFDRLDDRATEKLLAAAYKLGVSDTEAEAARLREERDKAQALNVYFRDAVGECHLMISRNTSEYQVQKEWEPVSLPPRLQKIMGEVASLRATLAGIESFIVLQNDIADGYARNFNDGQHVAALQIREFTRQLRATLAATEEKRAEQHMKACDLCGENMNLRARLEIVTSELASVVGVLNDMAKDDTFRGLQARYMLAALRASSADTDLTAG